LLGEWLYLGKENMRVTEEKKHQENLVEMQGEPDADVTEESKGDSVVISTAKAAMIAIVVSFLMVSAAYLLREPLGWSQSDQAGLIETTENLRERLAAIEDLARGERNSSVFEQSLSDFQTQLDSLHKSVESLSHSQDNTKTNGSQLKTLHSDFIKLQKDMALQLKGMRKEFLELSQHNKELKATLDSMAMAQVSDGNVELANMAARLVAATQLKQAVDWGRSFEHELSTFVKLSGADNGFLAVAEKLKTQASSGVASVQQLQKSFPILADELKKLESLNEEASFWDAVWGQLSSIVRIRRIEGASDLPGLDGVLARVTEALDASNLTAAIKELNTLDEKYRPVIEGWLSKASDSDHAMRLADKIRSLSLQLFSDQ
jgi:hypothetical protein